MNSKLIFGTMDLFGDIPPGKQPAALDKQDFSPEEVDAIFHDCPETLFRDFIFCIKYAKAHILGKEIETVSEEVRRLWGEFVWLYDLSETPARFTFDSVCSELGQDAEAIRSNVSHMFSKEIRVFYSAYACANSLDAARVAKKLHPYISVGH